MRVRIRIGVVCFARKTFDYQAALEIYKNIQTELFNIKNVDWEILDNLILNLVFKVIIINQFLYFFLPRM